MEQLDIEVNITSENQLDPNKIMPKLHDALTSSKTPDYEIEFRQQGQLVLLVRNQDEELIHFGMLEDFYHYNFHMQHPIQDSWVQIASTLLDKLILLLDTYGLKTKTIEVQGGFDIKDIAIQYQNFVNGKPLTEMVGKIDMPLAPLSTAFLSKYKESDIVIIIPQEEPADKDQPPTHIAIHNDYNRYETGVVQKIFEVATAIDEQLKPLKKVIKTES